LPWRGRPASLAAAAAGLVLIVTGILLSRARRAWPLLATTAAAMLLFDVMLTSHLARSEAGRSDMKPLADAIARRAPDAEVRSIFPAVAMRDARPMLKFAASSRIARSAPPPPI
jgi:hypothetical protein